MNKFRRIVLSSCLVLASSALVSPGVGQASSAKATAPKLVSGVTPLPAPGEPGHCGSEAAHQNWETDNSIAANPANNANLVAAWIQDYADAIVVGYSTDTGKTWNKSVPQTSGCTLRTGTVEKPVPDAVKDALSGHTSALDPWLSFGPPSVGTPQGTVYLTSVVQAVGNSKYAVIANRSTDGGATWEDPVVLDSITPEAAGPVGIDTSYVIADPAKAGHAYAVWTKGDFAFAARHQWVSRTVDGGESWSRPMPIPSGQPQFFGELLILPDGASCPGSIPGPASLPCLVNVAVEVPPQTLAAAGQSGLVAGQSVGPTTLVSRRSSDGGVTWMGPVVIGVADLHHVTGARSAMAPDGTIYTSWMRKHDSGSAAGSTFSLMYSKSADGGRTWSGTGPPDGDCGSTVLPGCVGPSAKGPPVTGSGIAVADDGTVGVMFYAHRNDTPPQDPPRVDVWFRHSHDGGGNWITDHLAGPFDMTSTGTGVPRPVGDYHGMTAAAGGFATTFSLADPLPGANFTLEAKPTDIFFSRLPRGQISRSQR